VSRASAVTAVFAGAALCAGPLVGVALAQPTLLSSNPANNAVITSAANLPTAVSVTYNEALNSPSSPVLPSHISMTLNGGLFPCTASISSDMKKLICTPFSGTKFTDGVYVVTAVANPALTTGDTTPSTDHVTFTVDSAPPTLSSRSPAADSRVQTPATVVATYTKKFDLATNTSSLTVTDSINNVVGGSSVATNPSSSTGLVTWTPDAPLPDGVYNAAVTATDIHGQTTSSTWQFTVDDVPPPAPVVVAPTFVSIANQQHVPITGTAVNDTGDAAKIRVTASDGSNTVTLPDVNVGNDGSWSAASVADLSGLTDGPLTISAKALDVAGNVSTASADQPSTKDTVAPTPAPSVSFPPGVTVNSSNPTLHVLGTTEDGVGVAVVAVDHLDNTTTPVTTTASNTDGSYDAVIDTTSLADGTLTITSTATDAAGNTSTGSNTISKDATPSGTPTITVFDPVNNANKGTLRPVSGKAMPGDTVNVWLTDSTSNTPVSEQDNVPVDGSGDWSANLDASTLADGPITAHAVDIDPSSNASAEATKVTIKDTGVPAAPTYSAPTWVNDATKSAVPISGTDGEPGTTVHLVTTDSGAGTDTVDLPVQGDGTWATTLDLHSFAEGTINYVATVVDQAGNQSSNTSTSSTKDTVAPGAPAAPTLSGPAADTSVVTATGSGTTGDTEQVSMTSDGGPGRATGSSGVVSSAYSVPVDASSLADGTLTAIATETDPAGNTSADSLPATVIKDTTAPLAVVSTVPADGSSVQTTPTLSATFNEQLDLAQSTVTLKDSVGAVLGHTAPTLSADKKTISVSPTNSPLAEADGYQLLFAVTELSHNETANPTVTFTVDRTAPGAPVIGSVADVSGGNVGSVPVAGTAAEPGGTINVTLTDGTHSATAHAPVANDGTWTSAVDASGLSEGPVTATATQTDAAGNESPASAVGHATKDTVAPTAPTIAWSGDVTQHALSVVLSGAAEPSSTVNVGVDDTDGATPPTGAVTTADSNGAWSTQLPLGGLDDGTLTAVAWATDAFGNVGPTASAHGVKDTVSPSISLTAPRAPFSLGTVTARWRASDAGSGLAAAPYDVRWARGAHGKPLGSYRLLAGGLKATSVTRTLSAGTTGCFEVRAHDAVGNVSGWTVARCSVVALDDSAMTASAGWTRAKDRRLYHGSAFTTTTHGATLTLPKSAFDRAAIVATHCPTCGSIAIFAGSHRLKVIDLSSASTRRRVITAFGQFPFRTAKLTIKVISRGKRVQIDGVGTSDR
jgi:methionine-rich copper-binding protein CopC